MQNLNLVQNLMPNLVPNLVLKRRAKPRALPRALPNLVQNLVHCAKPGAQLLAGTLKPRAEATSCQNLVLNPSCWF